LAADKSISQALADDVHRLNLSTGVVVNAERSAVRTTKIEPSANQHRHIICNATVQSIQSVIFFCLSLDWVTNLKPNGPVSLMGELYLWSA
jgi:hypothetical protein